MREVKISTENIKLDQALKLADLVESGGQAKMFIQDGLVTVNGEIELHRGKKINRGDIIELENIDSFIVI